jgi:predicted secreted protein
MDPEVRWPEGKRGWRSRYAHLLEEEPAFKAWRSNVLRASHNTGSAYFLRMGCLCDELYHIPPSRMASMNRAEGSLVKRGGLRQC